MISSIQNSASDSIQQMMALMMQNMGAADTDGTKGLSKSKLASVDAGRDVGGSAFLKSLTEQFDALDADSNGQLSSEEIASAKPPEVPMGPPPGLELDKSEETDSTDATSDTTSTSATSSTDKASSTDSIMQQILEALLNSFTDSYSKGNSADKASDAIASLSSTADTDGTKGLSKTELASVDTSQNTKEAGFINDLTKNFNSYDTDGDGQLSQSEMTAAVPKEFSQQEMASMAGGQSQAEKFGNFLGSTSGNFARQLMNSYQSGGLSDLASSLSVAV